jgi:hypothetical protein
MITGCDGSGPARHRKATAPGTDSNGSDLLGSGMPRNPNGTPAMRTLLAGLYRRGVLADPPLARPDTLAPAGRREARNVEELWRAGLGPVVTGERPPPGAVDHYAFLRRLVGKGGSRDHAALTMTAFGFSVSGAVLRADLERAFGCPGSTPDWRNGEGSWADDADTLSAAWAKGYRYARTDSPGVRLLTELRKALSATQEWDYGTGEVERVTADARRDELTRNAFRWVHGIEPDDYGKSLLQTAALGHPESISVSDAASLPDIQDAINGIPLDMLFLVTRVNLAVLQAKMPELAKLGHFWEIVAAVSAQLPRFQALIALVGAVTELRETDRQVEIERACENWHAIIGQVSVQCGISPPELAASLDLLGIVLLRPSTLTDYGIPETVTEMMMTAGRSAVETATKPVTGAIPTRRLLP